MRKLVNMLAILIWSEFTSAGHSNTLRMPQPLASSANKPRLLGFCIASAGGEHARSYQLEHDRL
jgi:hypothetical protein